MTSLSSAHGYFQVIDRCHFRLTGPDRQRYLNGQVTQDLSLLNDSQALPACVLNAKGKLEAEIFIWKEADTLIVEGPVALREALHARLEKYLIADQVEIEDATGTRTIFHLPGQSLPSHRQIARLGFIGSDVPEPPAGLVELPTDTQEYLRVLHGWPAWGKELQPDILPAEARLEAAAISFNKGCYIGQEVVSRIRSVGHVNKLLFGFSSETRIPPHGATIQALDSDSPIGRITSTASCPGGAGSIALGYLKRPYPEPGSRLVALDTENHSSVEVTVSNFPISNS